MLKGLKKVYKSVVVNKHLYPGGSLSYTYIMNEKYNRFETISVEDMVSNFENNKQDHFYNLKPLLPYYRNLNQVSVTSSINNFYMSNIENEISFTHSLINQISASPSNVKHIIALQPDRLDERYMYQPDLLYVIISYDGTIKLHSEEWKVSSSATLNIQSLNIGTNHDEKTLVVLRHPDTSIQDDLYYAHNGSSYTDYMKEHNRKKILFDKIINSYINMKGNINIIDYDADNIEKLLLQLKYIIPPNPPEGYNFSNRELIFISRLSSFLKAYDPVRYQEISSLVKASDAHILFYNLYGDSNIVTGKDSTFSLSRDSVLNTPLSNEDRSKIDTLNNNLRSISFDDNEEELYKSSNYKYSNDNKEDSSRVSVLINPKEFDLVLSLRQEGSKHANFVNKRFIEEITKEKTYTPAIGDFDESSVDFLNINKKKSN